MDDWQDIRGVPCDRCNGETFRVFADIRGRRLCRRCYEKSLAGPDYIIERLSCPQCGHDSLKLSVLRDSSLSVKFICVQCGSFSPQRKP